MAKNDVSISLNEVFESIDDTVAREMTEKILNLYIANGLTYKVKIGYGNVYRIFCYIKKSKEALIVNPIGKNFGPFELQMRIKSRNTLDNLKLFSSNVINQILASKDCRAPYCCNCCSEYKFTYKDKAFSKCHMLCDNFTFRNLKREDIDSIIDIIQDELDLDMPRALHNKKA